MIAMNSTGAIPTDMRESRGPLWGSTTGPGRSARCTEKSATCRWPAPDENSIRNDTLSRLRSWRRGMSRNPWLTFALFAGICFSVAAVGSVWTSRSVRDLVRAVAKAFLQSAELGIRAGLVGAVLQHGHECMAGLAKRRMEHARSSPSFIFFLQLGFNLAWSGLVFRPPSSPGLAFLDILALLATIVATAIVFRSFSEVAFWLMIPYAMWVSFASLLNFEIWRLNPGQS